jgi:hypothetical protein
MSSQFGLKSHANCHAICGEIESTFLPGPEGLKTDIAPPAIVSGHGGQRPRSGRKHRDTVRVTCSIPADCVLLLLDTNRACSKL